MLPTIIKGLKNPFPDILAESQKTCDTCPKKFHKDQRYNKCKECRRKVWEDIQLRRGIPLEVVKMKKRHCIAHLERETLLEIQQGCCAICFRPEEECKVLVIDHCHKSGKIRGLLCYSCNTGIGLLKDNIDVLKSAQNYLQIHKA